MSQLRTSEIPGPASGCIWSSSNLQIPDHCIRPSHKMHSRGNTTSDMHTKAEIRSGSGSWINIPVLLPFSKSFYPFVFLLFSPSFFFLPLLLYFIYHLYHFAVNPHFHPPFFKNEYIYGALWSVSSIFSLFVCALCV